MKITKKIIQELVNCVNEETNSNYELDYDVYGYQMYLIDQDGKVVTGSFGSFERRSLSEMHNYLLGLLSAIRYYNKIK